jgi:hypothetical protein
MEDSGVAELREGQEQVKRIAAAQAIPKTLPTRAGRLVGGERLELPTSTV